MRIHGHIHEGRIADVVFTVGKRQVKGLGHGVEVRRRIVPHGAQIKTLQDFQSLREDWSLSPGPRGIDIIAAIVAPVTGGSQRTR